MTFEFNSAASPAEALNQYFAAIDVCMDVYRIENAMIQKNDPSIETAAQDEQLLTNKKKAVEQLEIAYEVLKPNMLDAKLTYAEMETLKAKQVIFAEATAENYAYLQLAEALNQRILNLFINASSTMNKYAYNADGCESKLSVGQYGAFLHQSA
jgi:hypothetical protein